MSIYIDADALVRWEKEEFDLPTWLETHFPEDRVAFPATVWQQFLFGAYAWEPARAAKRSRSVQAVTGFDVVPFSRSHARRAAELAALLRQVTIGFADCQIAAATLEDNAELLTFNTDHFSRVPGLRLAPTA